MISFDRVADIYDATRGLPDDVSERIADRIVTATDATPETRFLELGVGTGRIALPLVKRGFPFTGVDISEQMLARFREKSGDAPNLTLITSDVTELPLAAGSQDVVLVVHVFHLIPEWRKALDEARRVLAPSGYFVWGGNEMPPEHPGGRIRRQWTSIVRELGGELRPRYGDWEHMQAVITESGGRTACYRATVWSRAFRPIDLLNALHERTFSAGWEVSQEVLDEAHERLSRWTREEFGDLETPLEAQEEFMVFVSWWEAPAG
jgi:ubiquinone/menaquinone biosynthesis C-methylase UbiE